MTTILSIDDGELFHSELEALVRDQLTIKTIHPGTFLRVTEAGIGTDQNIQDSL